MLNETMLIDDNPIDVMLNERVLDEASFSKIVTTVGSATEAIALLKERINNNESLPNLILLDMLMPEMDGVHFLNAFSQLPVTSINKTSIVVVSSAPGTPGLETVKSSPYVVDYLSKPLTRDKLKGISFRLV